MSENGRIQSLSLFPLLRAKLANSLKTGGGSKGLPSWQS